DDEHRAGDRASERRGVEVGNAGSGYVERARLQRGDALADQRSTAIDESRGLGSVAKRAARDVVVIVLVGLAEVRGVGVRDRAVRAHPVQRGAGVETARERDADFLAGRQTLQDAGHGGFGAARRRKTPQFSPRYDQRKPSFSWCPEVTSRDCVFTRPSYSARTVYLPSGTLRSSIGPPSFRSITCLPL